MTELSYSVELDEDEITVVVQLLNARICQMTPTGPGEPRSLESALLVRLLAIREEQIIAARAAGKLPPLPRFSS